MIDRSENIARLRLYNFVFPHAFYLIFFIDVMATNISLSLIRIHMQDNPLIFRYLNEILRLYKYYLISVNLY